MKPIRFKNYNKEIGVTDVLPIFTDDEQCVSCWKMTLKERIKALVFGKIWVSIKSGNTQPPIWVECSNNEILEINNIPVSKHFQRKK